MRVRNGLAVRGFGQVRTAGWVGVLLGIATLVSGHANACGMHGFGFSPFGASTAAASAPALPPGTWLTVPGMLTPQPDTPSSVTLTVATSSEFADPLLTIEGPEAVVFDDGRERPLVTGEQTITLPYSAASGYHWITFTVTGTLSGETVTMTRQVYVAVPPAADVAVR